MPQSWAADARGFMQDGKSIIEFNLDKKSDVTAKISGGSLIVRFDQPQESLSFDGIKSGLPDLVSETVLSSDKKTLIVGLMKNLFLRTTVSGTQVTLLMSAEPQETIAPGQKYVRIRTGQHKSFYRVVFEWAEPVGYEVRELPSSTTVIFTTTGPMRAQDLRKIRAAKITGATHKEENGKSVVTFDLAEPVALKHSINKYTVILDFTTGPAPKSAAAPAVKEEQTIKAAKEDPVKPAPSVAVKTEKPATEAAVPAAEKLDPKTEARFPLPVSQRGNRDEQREAELKKQDEAANQKTIAEESLDDPFAIQNLKLDAKRGENIVNLKFNWPKLVSLAVFRRAGFIWIVFDRPSKLEMDKESTETIDLIGGIEKVPNPAASIFRIRSVPGLEPSVWSDGKGWQIDLKPQKLRPNVAIPADDKDLGDGKQGLFLTVAQSGRVVSVDDPEVGDKILIATVKTVGRGINGEREYPDLTLLPTVQGIAVVPKTDTVDIRPDFEGFVVTSDKGLLLSAVSTQAEKSKKQEKEIYGPLIPEIKTSPAILKYAEWRGNPNIGFFDKERELVIKSSTLPTAEREASRMELAKLYFSYGWIEEGVAVLNVIAQQNDTAAKTPEFLAMRGVSYAMERNYRAANDDLKDQRFDEQSDIAAWRGVLAVQQSDWSASDQYFLLSDQPNLDQPPNMRKFVGLSHIESEINNGHYDRAKSLIDGMSKDRDLTNVRDILNYWRGEIMMREGNVDDAVKLWEKVEQNEEPYARPRAELALIKHAAESGSLKREDIIARLERLRFSWRGDKFEFDVLRMLGSMQIEDGLYREGLFTLRRAVANYADQPYTAELTDLMGQTFKKLFMDGAADNMPPLTALGLFDEFRELTPTGSDGDKIIQHLADRLIGVDLLNRAAELLSHQVNYRLSGAEKARVGARLAFVYLLDRKPGEAIKALDLSNAAQIEPAIVSERRLLRARALFDQNRSQEALDMIANDTGQAADLLRIDIYWRMQNWGMVANKFQKLISEEEKQLQEQEAKNNGGETAVVEAPKLTPQLSQWVLSMAIASALKGDSEALHNIKTTYWSRMKGMPQFEAFEVITQDDPTQALSISDLTGKLEEASKIESFMNYYREKIKKGGLANINQPESQTPPTSATQ